MTTDLATRPTADVAAYDPEQGATALAHILATGDLSKLTNEQRVAHYLDVCRSLGLNSLSRPFDWLTLDGRLVFYPNKSCAEQLRRLHQISVKIVRREIVGDMFCVVVEGRTPSGRTDEASKYVPLKDHRGNKLAGRDLANAFAKAETGAKRRLVFSMVGLASAPDPDEVRGARVVVVDGTGRVVENPTPEQVALAADPGMARAIGEPVYEDVAAQQAPFGPQPDQRPTEAELAPSRAATGQRPSFTPGAEDTKRWLGAWFAAVKGLSLDSDEARAGFVRSYTDGRTDSLREFFSTCTERQAGELLAHVRALMEGERAELLASVEEASGPSGDRVRDSVALTGGPVGDPEPAF